MIKIYQGGIFCMEKEEEKTQDEMINELIDKIVQNKIIENNNCFIILFGQKVLLFLKINNKMNTLSIYM